MRQLFKIGTGAMLTALFGSFSWAQTFVNWNTPTESVVAHASLEVAGNNAPFAARDSAGTLHVVWMQQDQLWYGRNASGTWNTRALNRLNNGIVHTPSLVVLENTIYIGWIENGAVVISRSTDSGATWAAPFALATGSHEAVTLTGGLSTTGTPLLVVAWHDTARLNGFAYNNFAATYSNGPWALSGFTIRRIASAGNSEVQAPTLALSEGAIYAAYASRTPAFQPNFELASNHSTDGGVTWRDPQDHIFPSDLASDPSERVSLRLATGASRRVLFTCQGPQKVYLYRSLSESFVGAFLEADLGNGSNASLAALLSRHMVAIAWERFSGSGAAASAKTVGLALSTTDGFTFDQNALPDAAGETGILRPEATASEKNLDVFWIGTAGGTRTLRHRMADLTSAPPDPLGGPTVVPNPQNPPRLVNLSVRIGDGGNLGVGLVIGGAGTSGAKSLLVRGIGPGLGQFGVSPVLTDPQLSLYSGSTTVATNDNWDTEPNAGSAAQQVGGFALPAGSKDAALFRALEPKDYTLQITTRDGSNGIALAEVYEVGTITSTTPRFVNLSARAQVDTGAGALFAGFVIGGEGRRRLLIRALGPTLRQFGLTGVLANPMLQLFRTVNGQQTLLAENDDWASARDLLALNNAIAATTFPFGGDTDSALVVTLDPGVYSAKVFGVNDTTGVALIEIYEVP